MNFFKLIIKSFKYFFKGNLAIAGGVALTAAVITGALMVGDSVQYSLEQATRFRLGDITHTVSGQDRIFTKDLGNRLTKSADLPVSAALYTQGSALKDGGAYTLDNVQIWGPDENFSNVSGADFAYDSLAENEAVVSENTAKRLMLKTGDYVLLRIRKTGIIPPNTPFAADNQTVSRRFKIKAIVGTEALGRLNLRQSQTAPFNVFLNYKSLSDVLDLENKANMLFISAEADTDPMIIKNALQESWTYRDANLKLRTLSGQNRQELISERVFIDSLSAARITSVLPHKTDVLTYFVNSIKLGEAEIPYSFVTGFSAIALQDNEIIINEWAADDLNAKIGDTIHMQYFTVGPLKQLDTDSAEFIIKKIVPLEGIYADKKFMPVLPGLSDAGSCSDWNTGVPIDLDDIRDKDELYWKRYKGTPKAFISYQKAADLWSNRFGAHTAFRFSSDEYSKAELQNILSENIRPSDYGISVNAVMKNGLKAAKNGVDFGQLFLALSFFIIVSGILLTVLFFKFHIRQRNTQIGTYSAIGYSDKQIIRIILGEQFITAFMGSLVGIFIALLYNELVFNALNNLWYDIVRTDVLVTKLYPSTLLLGFVITFGISLLSQYFTVRRMLKQESADLQKRTILSKNNFWKRLHTFSLYVFPIVIIALAVMQFTGTSVQNPALFFVIGGMLLIYIVLLTAAVLKRLNKKSHRKLSLSVLSAKNAVRNPQRSLMVVLLLSIGTFLVISTGINKKDMFSNAEKKSSGTGGFVYYAESTVPILEDLNEPDVRRAFSLDKSDTIVQFKVAEGDDAGCLNLNRVSNPRILAAKPELLSGHFSFVTKTDFLNEDNPWKSLNRDSGDFVPAIADQTVIQWGLGKKVGDTLSYINAHGESITLKLIGGLKASVFQGNVIISEKHFLRHFPYSDGSNVFLIDGNFADSASIREELNLAFSDYGFAPELTARRLAEFKSVENTYLSIFLVLGAIGLLLGIIGLAVVIARSVWERRSESALLTTVGYSQRKVFRLYFREYVVLMLTGIFGGAAAAIISVLPSILSPNTDSDMGFVLLLLFVIMLNGFIWIAVSIYVQLKRLAVRPALQADA
jgi:ABC-type antimicrobial peptide transport system permease subunit